VSVLALCRTSSSARAIGRTISADSVIFFFFAGGASISADWGEGGEHAPVQSLHRLSPARNSFSVVLRLRYL
jgi:hypothetical protein